jgi:metal-dependent HD superfamily phosphatase/phosphodiesterase
MGQRLKFEEVWFSYTLSNEAKQYQMKAHSLHYKILHLIAKYDQNGKVTVVAGTAKMGKRLDVWMALSRKPYNK